MSVFYAEVSGPFPSFQEGVDGMPGKQKFPFRIVCMLVHLLIGLAVTQLTNYLHRQGESVCGIGPL